MIDDSAADRKLCRVLLQEIHGAPLEFIEESSATRALETCRTANPDCVLLDYRLPDMTGLDFLRQLQGDLSEGAPNFAVVMLTGLASEQVAVDAMKAGAQDYLVKDRITAEGLNLAIDKAMQKVGLLRTLRAERDRLAHSLAEKEVLIKEVHHRVKNNLQVIASLLRLQAGAHDNPELSAALRESQTRVESMALIHEQLYESENLREVDLARHADLLLTSLFHSYGVDPARIAGRVAIPLSAGSAPLVLEVNQAIPAGLILNELISNALKHAFPGGRTGSITIEGEQRNGQIILSVHDDGVGLAEDFEAHGAKSLGLQIVKILTRQLRGELTVERSAAVSAPQPAQRSAGATFRISFPERQN